MAHQAFPLLTLRAKPAPGQGAAALGRPPAARWTLAATRSPLGSALGTTPWAVPCCALAARPARLRRGRSGWIQAPAHRTRRPRVLGSSNSPSSSAAPIPHPVRQLQFLNSSSPARFDFFVQSEVRHCRHAAAALLFRSPSFLPGVPPSPATRRRRFAVVASARTMPWPHVLTVAGSDSGAGAGIQADIKACAALGAYCSSVITAVTAQNTVGVQGVHAVPEEFVGEQLRSVLSDMSVDVVKTGMLPSAGVIKILCESLRKFPVKALVVDPVMVSTSGDTLSGPSTLATYRDELFSMADIVTPNLKEASKLLGDVSLHTISDMRNAAESIYKFGPKYVLVKGGHMPDSSDAIDVFFDGKEFIELHGLRVKTHNTHGTGCTLASCIAAELAKGATMLHAVQVAKKFVESALYHSKDLVIGNGPQGPFDHLFNLKSPLCKMGSLQKFNPDDLFLYAVTDSGMNKKWGRSIKDTVKAAIEGGATIVQLREKDAETREFLEAAKACVEICKSNGVPLLINDRIDVALACKADGVHVGQSDMPAWEARELLGPGKIIGVSCKTPAQAVQAWKDGADYIGCGGVFPTTTKANNPTLGFEGLRTVCSASKLPVVAIGGINARNAGSVMELGLPNLKGVAVVSALFDQECVTTETRNLRSILKNACSRP